MLPGIQKWPIIVNNKINIIINKTQAGVKLKESTISISKKNKNLLLYLLKSIDKTPINNSIKNKNRKDNLGNNKL